ncbi:hypothetical protein Rsub_02349 [Raphidocelis subcapitata]|uniref:Uncharacterized protein n=1 Tax=Raphidocelis subcapitata TaxID=307507 RepID=A0A2V0NPR9_9CHLO|nr:hypothetical protein Rsub_02349 [Raphidocelis subcapitata]|eukprot:GBF89631.1 hypothetical protein Rsub_02349 [Raphidocelis subcapitata]
MEPETEKLSGGGGATAARRGEAGDAHAAATAWLWDIYREMRCTSRDGLFAYFRGPERGRDLTPEILNLVGRMAKCGFPDYEAASFVSDPEGGGDRLDCALAASYLYYRVCEWELARRFPIRPDSAEAARQRRFKGLARELLAQGDFHAALLHCALEVTAFAAHPAEPSLHYPAMTRRLGREAMGVSLSFRGCFAAAAAAGAAPLPAAVEALLGHIEAAVLGGGGLATGSCFHTIALHGGGYCYADGDPTLACDFFSAYAAHTVAAGARAAAALVLPPPPAPLQQGAGQGAPAGAEEAAAAVQGVVPDYPQEVARLLDELLLREAGLFYGQPAAVMVGCAAYIVAKLRGRDVRFSEVEQAILLTLPGTEPGTFDRAEVGLVLPPAPTAAPVAGAEAAAAVAMGPRQTQPAATQQPLRPVYGHMRQFYNKRFLPAAEEVARAVTAGGTGELPPVAAPPSHPLVLRRQQMQAAAEGAAAAAAVSRKQRRAADDGGGSGGAATAPPQLRLAAVTLPPPSAGTRAARKAEAATAAEVPGKQGPPAAPMQAAAPSMPFTVAEDDEIAISVAADENGGAGAHGGLSDGPAAPPRGMLPRAPAPLANAQQAAHLGGGAAVKAARAKGGGGAAAGGLVGAGIEWRRGGFGALPSGPGTGAAVAAADKENAPGAAAVQLAAAAAAAASSAGQAPQLQIQDPSPGTVRRVLGFLGGQRRGRGASGGAGKGLAAGPDGLLPAAAPAVAAGSAGLAARSGASGMR